MDHIGLGGQGLGWVCSGLGPVQYMCACVRPSFEHMWGVRHMWGTGVCSTCRVLGCAAHVAYWGVQHMWGTGVCSTCRLLGCAAHVGHRVWST